MGPKSARWLLPIAALLVPVPGIAARAAAAATPRRPAPEQIAAPGGTVQVKLSPALPGPATCSLSLASPTSVPAFLRLPVIVPCHAGSAVGATAFVPPNTGSSVRTFVLSLTEHENGHVWTTRRVLHQGSPAAVVPAMLDYVTELHASVGAPFEYAVVGEEQAVWSCLVFSDASIVLGGALPRGLSVAEGRCMLPVISGTPAPGSEGNYPLTFTASQAGWLPETMQLDLVVGDTTVAYPHEQTPLSPVTVPTLAAVPSVVNYGRGVDFPSFGNAIVGDCSETGVGDLAIMLNAEAGRSAAPSLLSMLQLYAWATGGQSGPDVGSYVESALWWWEHHAIDGLVLERAGSLPSPTDPTQVRTALWLAGGLLAQFDWPGLGEHAALVTAASPSGVTMATWGSIQKVSWAQWDAMTPHVFVVQTNAFPPGGPGPSGGTAGPNVLFSGAAAA